MTLIEMLSEVTDRRSRFGLRHELSDVFDDMYPGNHERLLRSSGVGTLCQTTRS